VGFMPGYRAKSRSARINVGVETELTINLRRFCSKDRKL